jgi:Spy/CpxP family protein refolding chaperone
MNSRLVQLLLALSLLLNCFVLAGFVYRSWVAPPFGDHPGGPPPPPGGRPPAPFEIMMNDLKLDDAQRKALHDQFERNGAERRDRIHQIQLLREQTGEELKKQPIDFSKVDALVDQIARLRGEQQKANLHGIIEMDTQLTPQQRERMHQILAERFLGMGGPGRPGGPRFGGQGPGPGPGGRPPQ